MKKSAIILLVALLGVSLLASTSFGRAKPLKPMLSGAKIAIVEGRPDEALTLLDSISMNYGMVPEAYQWAFRVYADKVDAAGGLEAKREPLVKMLAYIDSLHYACEVDGAVQDKKYRKDCGKFTELADSTKLKYFREFYNEGHQQIDALQGLAADKENEADSGRLAYIQGEIDDKIEQLIASMSLAILIDSVEFSPYVAIGDAYERAGNYEKAIEWMTRGYERAENPVILSQQLAYYYVQKDDYCGAIPYFRQYVEANPDSLLTMNYLAVCYNNCGLDPAKRMYLDSAMQVYREILTKQPNNPDIQAAAGRFFLLQAQNMNDSSAAAKSASNAALAAEYDSKRREMFDSSRGYFKAAWTQAPDNAAYAEQFAFTSALLQDCESAVQGFEVVATAHPEDAGNWTSLGDCYLRMAKFPEAIRAYEKVAELRPNQLQVWENLVALYGQEGMKDKAAQAQKKVDELLAASKG